MARKDFHFDFNEDAEPVEELHRLRVAMAEHFKTTKAIMEYINSQPTPKELLAERAAEAKKAPGKKTPPQTVARRKAPAAKTARTRRKPAKQSAHA